MTLFAFLLSTIVFSLQSTLYPELPVLAFAPFLALVCLLRKFSHAVLFSTIAGLLLDLFSQEKFGFHALVYASVSALCFRWKKRFSVETPMQFSMYTALVSLVCTTLHITLLFLFDRRIPFPGRWWMTEWLCLPLFDGAYALLWFTGPLALYRELRRQWAIYWLKKQEMEPDAH